MANNEQTGYFEIDASDINTTDEIIVPKDKVGKAPSGEPNDDQEKYDLATDGESHDWYVHVVNTTGQSPDARVLGSHMFDEDFDEWAEIKSSKNVGSDGEAVFSGGQNPSFLGVGLNFSTAPTSGKIKVVIQKASI